MAPRLDYAPVLPGLVACGRCAALLVDADAARAAHARFHEGLRQLLAQRGPLMTGPARPPHRLDCPGCGWAGYRRSADPWARDCPRCGLGGCKLLARLAGTAPRQGRAAYLIEISPPYRHAGHYLGFTTDLRRRWPEHLVGGYDPATRRATGKAARLLAAALHHGHRIELVRVWYGSQARALEQKLKQRRKPGSLRAGGATSHRPLCPLCNPRSWWRRYPNLPDPPRQPSWHRFRPDPAFADPGGEWDAAFPHLA